MTPIRLHTAATPNGHKASVMLEETGPPYEVRHADIERGGQIGVPIDDLPALSRWYATVGERPAVRRGLAVPRPARVHA